MGASVTQLDDDTLLSGNLDGFDVIVSGVFCWRYTPHKSGYGSPLKDGCRQEGVMSASITVRRITGFRGKVRLMI